MLGVKAYPKDFVEACRVKIEADVAAYKQIASAAGAGAALTDFETKFFGNMVIVLDALFMHRLRTVEGKDGNPANEVRAISSSLVSNFGTLTLESSMKLDPKKSVLGIPVGGQISITAADFERLSTAYFAEIERKFT
jgi:hypothetical protein